MSDSLMINDRLEDRRIFLLTNPPLADVVRICTEITLRSFDGEGRALALRILRACVAATSDLCPSVSAPRSHLAAYGRVRTQLYSTLFGVLVSTGSGRWRPQLTTVASDAMDRILAVEPTKFGNQSTPAGRNDDLIVLLAGYTWLRI